MVVRLLPIDWYDRTKGKWKDWAFKLSTTESRCGLKGISVVDLDCIDEMGLGFCEYVLAHCASQFSPTIGWFIPDGVLPEDSRIVNDEEDDSTNPCHRNVVEITNGPAKRLFKQAWENNRENFYYCSDTGLKVIEDNDLATLTV